jgi:hypothetical protein
MPIETPAERLLAHRPVPTVPTAFMKTMTGHGLPKHKKNDCQDYDEQEPANSNPN